MASHATQDKRADVLYAGFTRLRELGYRLDTVTSFRDKHVQALMSDAQARGLSASTLQNTLSIFRTFAGWIGKPGMVQHIEHYLGPGVAVRSSIATDDKGGTSQSIDIAATIAAVRTLDPRVALQLELQATFGLRAREAMQLRPQVADQGNYLAVNLGTKGGRDRVVPIDTPEKRALLEQAKTFTATRTGSTSDPHLKLHQWKNHYYHVVRRCGLTRDNGLTSHGLRHGYAQQRYEALSGTPAPVRAPDAAPADRDTDHAARLVVAEELGHSRESVTTYYLGR